MKLKISLILIVFILNVNNVFPQSKGTTSASFLKIAVGARNIALGETGATSEDVNSIYWNPAGLNSLKEKEISFTHTMWFETINYEHIAGVFPTRYGNLGFGLNYLSMGDMDKYDNTGTKQNSKMSANDIALTFAYSRKNLIPSLNFGFNLKYLRSKLEEESASAIATDIGFQTETQNPKLKFGLVIQNIGTKMKFIKESFSLPTNVKFGAGYSLLIDSNPLNLLFDINFPNDNNPRLNFGAEYVIRNWRKVEIFPRLGYGVYHKGFEDTSGITTGIGFKFENYTLDYAFVPYGELGNTHRISFSMKFGGKIKEDGKEKMEKVQEVFIKEQPKETKLPQTVEESTPIVKPEEEPDKELEEKIMSDLKLKLIFNSDKLFSDDGFTLTPEGYKTLNEIGQLLFSNTKDKVLIEGHTDNVGSREMNMELSIKRAKSVYDYFVKQGIESGRMEIKGYGFDKPIASNDTVEGRAKNRRVEVIIVRGNARIHFCSGEYSIKDEINKSLNETVELIKAYPEDKVLIEVHTDNIGSREMNIELSKKQAQIIYNYLVQKGIDASRIKAKGYGPDKPIASNDTDEGRAKNRRVEIILYK